MICASAKVSLAALPAYAQDRIAAAQRFPKEGLQTSRFSLPKLDLDVWFSGPEMERLCRQRLVQRDAHEAADGHAGIYMLDATLENWDHPATWDVDTGFGSREFDRALADVGLRGYYHHDAPSWQFFDPAAGVGVHTLPGPMEIPPWESGSPLRLFLHWAYARQNQRLTHAATLGFGENGALLAGASGSGKSGTTLAGLLNGLRSAGDDYVLVEQGPEITAHAVFRIFKQDSNGLQRVGLDAESVGATELNWHGKYEFDAMKLKPGAFVNRLPIKAILLPEIARLPRTRIEPISAIHAALALAPSAVFQLPGDTDEGFRFFAELARKLPAFRVRLSEEPAEIADAIGKHLSGEIAHAD